MLRSKILLTLVVWALMANAQDLSTLPSSEARAIEEITAAERELDGALQKGDAAALERLLAHHYTRTTISVATLFSQTKEAVVKRTRQQTAGSLSISARDLKIQVDQESAVATAKKSFTTTGGGSQPFEFWCIDVWKRRNGRWLLLSEHRTLDTLPPSRGAAAAPMPEFEIVEVPANVKEFRWEKLSEDAANDAGWADGKALSYYFDRVADMLWFKFDLYSPVDWELPSATVSLDIDNDQSTGAPWWGTNRQFNFDTIVFIGPTSREGSTTKYKGNNGISYRAFRERPGFSNQQGVVTFYIDSPSNAYVIGVKRTDIAPDLKKFRLLGSVGTNATWNDDLLDKGFATIELPLPE
ncbi:MAG: nuclear transport factor 2 family protein [Acidobacteria bacterium]|nr:nuclear transport factor 2 family protein [Acidobacteriota bacterium]